MKISLSWLEFSESFELLQLMKFQKLLLLFYFFSSFLKKFGLQLVCLGSFHTVLTVHDVLGQFLVFYPSLNMFSFVFKVLIRHSLSVIKPMSL